VTGAQADKASPAFLQKLERQIPKHDAQLYQMALEAESLEEASDQMQFRIRHIDSDGKNIADGQRSETSPNPKGGGRDG
jgi:hypothetical protein